MGDRDDGNWEVGALPAALSWKGVRQEFLGERGASVPQDREAHPKGKRPGLQDTPGVSGSSWNLYQLYSWAFPLCKLAISLLSFRLIWLGILSSVSKTYLMCSILRKCDSNK